MDRRLTYRTPDADTLGQYARQGRVDTAAPIQAAARVLVQATPERVWEVLTDVDRWTETLEPGVSRINLPDGLVVGATLDRSNQGFRMHARFEVVRPLQELAWTGHALGIRVVHRFTLTPTHEGTLVACQESMGGRPAAVLYSSARLQAGMEAGLAGLQRACEQ